MSNRKILYGYQVQDGALAISHQEKPVVERIVMLYLEGFSYQRISDILNQDQVPFSEDAACWNKHKVKRLLENPRYTGASGYPSIIERDVFQKVQQRIRDKTAHYQKKDKPIKDDSLVEKIKEVSYIPSDEVVRLTNAINRGLEHPDRPDEVVGLILQGISARYDSLK